MNHVLLLSLCQGLLLTQGVTLIAVTGLAGLALAPNTQLATLPLSAYVLGGAATTLPAAFFMRRHGRRAGFALGALLGLIGCLIAAAGVATGSFPLLCLGLPLCGAYNAFGQQYRFAAAEIAEPSWRGKAISLTLAGGILGGVLGPEMGKATRTLLEPAFLGTYLSLSVVSVIALALISRLDIPPLPAEQRRASGRPLAEIARQPAFLLAVLAAATGYGVMNLLMTATPLAMDVCGLPFADTAFVLEWHVIGMFAPSFFTGSLIKRFGIPRVLGAGSLLMAACIAITLSGTTLTHFWWALLLLGVGWNFLYIGGTTLLTETCDPEERAKVQGTNDFLVFGTQAATSLSSGLLLSRAGWETLNWYALPAVGVVAAAVVAYALTRKA